MTSGASAITFGVLLGPLLFVIFMNALPDSLLNCDTCLYADDTAIKVLSVDPIKLAKAVNCMSENYLMLNMGKTKCMFFGRHNTVTKTKDVKVWYDDMEIENVTSY